MVFKKVLKTLISPYTSMYRVVKNSQYICLHNYEYRDIILKSDQNSDIDNTVFNNGYRKCIKCDKLQKAKHGMHNDFSNWKTMDSNSVDFSKNPIECHISLYGRLLSKSQEREIKINKLLS